MQVFHIDRRWNLEKGTPTQHYADHFVREYFGEQVQVQGIGPVNATRSLGLEKRGDVCLILPWRGASWPKYVAALRALVPEILKQEGTKIYICADDLHQLLWSNPIFVELNALDRCVLVTNFRDTSTVWPGTEGKRIFWPYYPFHTLHKPAVIPEPTFELGYVGRFNPRRMTILKRCAPKDLVLMGPQWYNQTDFRHAFTEGGGKHWIDVLQVYYAAKWHISVQDFKQQDMKPRISRFGECQEAGRAMLIHQSHVDAMPEFPWPMDLVWSREADLKKLMGMDYEEAQQMLSEFCDKYYGDEH